MIAEEQFLEPEGMLISMASESGITVSISSVVVESFKGGERINWRDLTLATWGSSGLYIVVSGSSSGSCTVEANCALSGIETDHRPLGNVLDESSVRRIVEEVVQRENAKLLLAVEQLLAKNRQ